MSAPGSGIHVVVRPARPRPNRVDMWYPRQELEQARREAARQLRKTERGQRIAKVVGAVVVLGLYWLLFTHMR